MLEVWILSLKAFTIFFKQQGWGDGKDYFISVRNIHPLLRISIILLFLICWRVERTGIAKKCWMWQGNFAKSCPDETGSGKQAELQVLLSASPLPWVKNFQTALLWLRRHWEKHVGSTQEDIIQRRIVQGVLLLGRAKGDQSKSNLL